MIQVNNRPIDYFENMTVKTLLEHLNYTYPKIIVKINGEYIPKEKYAITSIKDGDEVLALHMFGGG